MSDSVTTTVEVAVAPEVAFDVFTREIDAWYRVDGETLPDITRTAAIRFEPHLGGRLLDVHDLATGEGRELGRVTAWEPGRRLVFVDNEGTEVEVTFERRGSATRVRLTHRGLDRLAPTRAQLRRRGWAALARLYADHIVPNARPVALAVAGWVVSCAIILVTFTLPIALGGPTAVWIAVGAVLSVAAAGVTIRYQARLARRWLPSEWHYRQIWWRVGTLGPLVLVVSGLYAVIEHGDDPLNLTLPALLLMLYLTLQQEGPARGRSLRRRPGALERRVGRRRAHLLFVLGIFAFFAAAMFGLNAIDERLFPALLGILAAYLLYHFLSVRRLKRRLGCNPDLYLAVERRVSDDDLRPELLVHRPSEQPEYSGWHVYASERDQASSDLVPWSMRDLLEHTPEAADPLREGHGKWIWDRARNAYSPVG